MSTNKENSLIGKVVNFPFFILLMGLFPVLSLLATDAGQTNFTAAGTSFTISVLTAILFSLICLLVFRPVYRGYLVSVLFYVAFFVYGHMFNLIDGQVVAGLLIGRHKVFLPMFLAVVLGVLVLILVRPVLKKSPAPMLNFLSLCLCLLQVVILAPYWLTAAEQAPASESINAAHNPIANESTAPDIYYIVIDGLAREDVLQKSYSYNDYSLPDELRKRGFDIPDCAFSNYWGTATSLSSSLNMDYLDALGMPDEQEIMDDENAAIFYKLLHQNRVVAYLKERGYQFVSFRGFFPLNDFREADYYYSFFQNELGLDFLSERSFREMFLRTTLLRLPVELIESQPEAYSFIPRPVVELLAPEASVFSSRSYQWYQQHLYTFDMLETVPDLPGKKFTYVHFYTTHQPYVLKPDGSLAWPINEDQIGYIDAIRYTSKRLLEVVDRILADSPSPPVIVIQSDHGHSADLNLYKILNAYYLPGAADPELYATITPVNTFRVILNQYAGGAFQLLPDILMVRGEDPHTLTRVPVSCGLK